MMLLLALFLNTRKCLEVLYLNSGYLLIRSPQTMRAIVVLSAAIHYVLQTMKTVTKPITASEEELEENPRARSARLRVAERI